MLNVLREISHLGKNQFYKSSGIYDSLIFRLKFVDNLLKRACSVHTSDTGLHRMIREVETAQRLSGNNAMSTADFVRYMFKKKHMHGDQSVNKAERSFINGDIEMAIRRMEEVLNRLPSESTSKYQAKELARPFDSILTEIKR